MWLRQKLRRGLYKPAGLPRLGSNIPRGLVMSLPMVGQPLHSFGPMWPGKPARIGASEVLGITQAGYGLQSVGSTTAYNVGWSARDIAAPFSMEVLFWSGATITDRTIISFNAANDGSSAVYDKQFFFDSLSRLSFYTYGGSNSTLPITTRSFSANTLYHAVFTLSGSTGSLYVNGAPCDTYSSVSTFSSYGTPYVCVGTSTIFASLGASSATVLLANIATVAWTAAEINDRAIDPWGMFEWPDDDLFSEMVGTGTVRPRVFRVDYGA